MNLGYLYEQGLGVPKDPGRAAEWYAKAAGLNTVDLPFAASVQISSAANVEVNQLRAQVASQEQEMQRLREQLGSSSNELARLRERNDASKDEIDKLQEQLAERAAAAGTESAQLQRLTRLLEQREEEMARLRSDVDFLSRESALQNTENSTQLDQLQMREQELRTQLQRAIDAVAYEC